MKKTAAVRLIWPYLKPHMPSILIAMLLSIPMAAIAVLPARLMSYLTDHVLVKKDYEALRVVVAALLFGFVLNFVVRFFNNFLIRSAANSLTQKLRNDIYQQLLRLSVGYFNEAQGGTFISRVINDVQLISRAVSSFIDIVKEPLTLIGLLGYAIYLNWALTLFALILIPISALLLSNAGRHSKRYTHRIYDKMGEMSALLSESISGMRVIQAFGLQSFLKGQFMKANRDFSRTVIKAIRMEELSRPAVELVFGFLITFLVFYAGREALKGRMSPGDVIAFFSCFGMMLNPLKKLSDLNISLNQSLAAIETVFGILHLRPEIEDKPGAQRLAPFAREIEFKNISFAFNKGEANLFENFSLTIKKGEVVALVGASGAGKSTLLSLIPRFFDPRAGAVSIDGVNVRDATLESLRAQVALVTQDVFLFHDTVRANIKAGRHQLSDAQVRAAAEAAQAWGFIEKMPKGLETEIGDRGQKLSGGERQRLSIARALLKDAPILLLDEATSALDGENERLVQAALDRLLVGRTAIVVAHRLSTIRKATRILVMEKGRILEEGTHEGLLAKGGAYAQALSLQEGFSLT
jgi:subfamily B ATP-binding cassette protein MsbA